MNGSLAQEANLTYAYLQKANLGSANLQEANLSGANLQGANLNRARGLTAPQVKHANNWDLAFYSDDLFKELGLPSDHNETLRKKFAEIEKKEKEVATMK